MINKSKALYIFFAVLGVFVFILPVLMYWFAFYGLTFPPCGDRIRTITLPEKYKDATLKFTAEMHFTNPETCVSPLSGLTEIKDSRRYPGVDETGVLPPRKEFRITELVEVYPYGFSGIGPQTLRDAFIVVDAEGKTYFIPWYYLEGKFTFLPHPPPIATITRSNGSNEPVVPEELVKYEYEQGYPPPDSFILFLDKYLQNQKKEY